MPALNNPVDANYILDLIKMDDIEVHAHSIKENQTIYAVRSLNWEGTFEGALTFSEGRDISHIDGGLLITEGEPVSSSMSYITVSFPRVAMAVVLERLFPGGREQSTTQYMGWNTHIGENTSIGHPGFGWVKRRGGWARFPHVGGVRIGSHTTIGANVTICRGTLSDTIIGSDCHIDDHVHIAHGCVIGDRVIIAANAMLAGSVTVEDDAWIGPSASIMQGVRIGKGATIGIGAVVLRDVAPGETVVGHHRVIPTKDVQLGVTRPPIPLYDDV